MGKTGLTRWEQETVINHNNLEKEATIYSRDPVILRKLAKLAEKYPETYILVEEDDLGKTYRCTNKKLISFRAPSRELTEEEKEIAKQHLAKYAFGKKND